jgi:hypothetical protein
MKQRHCGSDACLQSTRRATSHPAKLAEYKFAIDAWFTGN